MAMTMVDTSVRTVHRAGLSPCRFLMNLVQVVSAMAMFVPLTLV